MASKGRRAGLFWQTGLYFNCGIISANTQNKRNLLHHGVLFNELAALNFSLSLKVNNEMFRNIIRLVT